MSSLTRSDAAAVVPLALNTPQRFYRGGERILTFRGAPRPADFDGRRPEDWLASTTRLFAEGGDGLSTLPDGELLAGALEQDPEAWLGPEHLARHGAEPGLLVKLLDAAERLPVHTHPDRDFALRYLHCPHGKTEAWLVVEAGAGAMVWLGFREPMSREWLVRLVAARDERLLQALNGFEVARGDAILVPAGQPHAIGAGVMVVELQEPPDFTVMLEHHRFGLDPSHAWLGLGQELALDSVTSDPLEPDRLASLRTRWDQAHGIHQALSSEAAEFFTAEAIVGDDAVVVEAGFSVLVVVDGAGTLRTAAGQTQEIRAGQTLLTPFAAGAIEVEGQVTVLRCSPARTAGTDDPLARSDATTPQEAP